MKIHPTAIIEDGAVLGADVEIGPYSLIGPQVVIGDGCRILGHAVLTSRVTLGPENVVGFGAVGTKTVVISRAAPASVKCPVA